MALGWGLIGSTLYLLAGVLVLYGMEPFGATQNAMNAPLGLQEMVFAVWLIVRGSDVSRQAGIAVADRMPVAVAR